MKRIFFATIVLALASGGVAFAQVHGAPTTPGPPGMSTMRPPGPAGLPVTRPPNAPGRSSINPPNAPGLPITPPPGPAGLPANSDTPQTNAPGT